MLLAIHEQSNAEMDLINWKSQNVGLHIGNKSCITDSVSPRLLTGANNITVIISRCCLSANKSTALLGVPDKTVDSGLVASSSINRVT